MKRIGIVMAGLALIIGTGVAVKAHAGTQDFVLVNDTGVTIHNLFISESNKEEWEEDVLGEDVLEDGDSVGITFKGKKACKWDLMVKDEDGEGIYWRKVDLCSVSRVVLHCDAKKCWATFD